MRYVQNRSNWSGDRSDNAKSGKGRKVFWLVGIATLLILVIVFAGGGLESDNQESTELEGLEELEELEELTSESLAPETQEEEDNTTFQLEQIDLVSILTDAGYSGIARRGTTGNLFTHVVVADLGRINLETHFYEGWLVKPGVMDFFSTGEMFAREDGKFGLAWEVMLDDARADLFDFTNVVITLEPRDGNSAPSIVHVLEGEF